MIDATVSFEKGEAWIKYDDQKVTVAKLREVINSTGFKAVKEKHSRSTRRSNRKASHQEVDRQMIMHGTDLRVGCANTTPCLSPEKG